MDLGEEVEVEEVEPGMIPEFAPEETPAPSEPTEVPVEEPVSSFAGGRIGDGLSETDLFFAWADRKDDI